MLQVILGGLTGLLGNGLTAFFKYKNIKLEHAHNEKMVELEINAMTKEAEIQIQITKSRIEGEIELADVGAFDTAQKVGSKQLFSEKWIEMLMVSGEGKWTGWFFKFFGTIISAGFAFVDWLNAMMRPGLTIYLMIASSYITYLAWSIMRATGLDSFSAVQAMGLFSQITDIVIYLTVSAVTFWYGDRTMSKFLQEKGKDKLK